MGVRIVSLIIAAFVEGSLGIAALMRNFRSRLCISFAILAATCLLHDLFALLEGFNKGEAFANPSLHSAATMLTAPAWLWFLAEVLGEHKVTKTVWAYLGLFAVVLFVSIWDSANVYRPLVSLLSHVSLLIPVGIWLLTLANRAKEEKLTRERIRFRFAFWAGVIALVICATDILEFGGTTGVPPLGTLARTLYLLFLFQTFVQKQLLTVEEMVTKIVLFGGVSLIISSVLWLLVLWVGDKPGLFFFNTLITSFAVIILFDPFRALIARQVRKLFSSRNFLMEEELAKLSRDIMGIVEPQELSRRIQKAIKNFLQTDQCTLYIIDREGLSYWPVGKPEGADLSASSPLVEYMTLRRGRPFVNETIENDKESFHDQQPIRFCQLCLDTMRSLGADLVIPLNYESKVAGFCAISTGERIILSNEQLRLFTPVARQIGQLIKSTQAFSSLRERDKLSAVGEMAAGLAHEIKNPLGAIHGAAELLADGTVTDKNEYLKIILDETNRLSRVLTDFLDYAKPRRQAPAAECEVVAVLEHTVNLVLRDKKIKFEIQQDGPNTVQVDPELLKQVFLNLFLNAIQALEGIADPAIRVSIREVGAKNTLPFLDSIPLFKSWEGWEKQSVSAEQRFIEVIVSDNGVGLKPQEVERVFLPFYTTKASGTGLGLAICQRLIESIGGTIVAKANRTQGSSFTIHLPIRKEVSERKSDFIWQQV